MNDDPKGTQAARVGRRRLDLLRRFPIPDNLLAGALARVHPRCGVAWSLKSVSANQHRVERIPKQWAETVAGHTGRIENVKLDLLGAS